MQKLSKRQRVQLSRNLGHNLYGEPAYPNDLLYVFPVVILCFLTLLINFAVLNPVLLAENADPFNTPSEILPEWYFFATFQILRKIQRKIIGVLCLASIPFFLACVPWFEGLHAFQNPFRRPFAIRIFIFGSFISFYLSWQALQPI